MDLNQKSTITVKTIVQAPMEKVWECWTQPEHIQHWNNADESWYTPNAVNDLKPEGKFLYRMEAKDGSMGFDFEGTYTVVETHALIEYVLGDGRNVRIDFVNNGNNTEVIEKFEAEETHTKELQQSGWQSILNNFKNYTESV